MWPPAPGDPLLRPVVNPVPPRAPEGSFPDCWRPPKRLSWLPTPRVLRSVGSREPTDLRKSYLLEVHPPYSAPPVIAASAVGAGAAGCPIISPDAARPAGKASSVPRYAATASGIPAMILAAIASSS